MKRAWIWMGVIALIGTWVNQVQLYSKLNSQSAFAESNRPSSRMVATIESSNPSISKPDALPRVSPSPSSDPMVKVEDIEKMLDEDNLCGIYALQANHLELIREVMKKRALGLYRPSYPLLFTGAEDLLNDQNNPSAKIQFYQALYHAGLLGGLTPAVLDYPLALQFLDRAIADQPENGIFYLYKSYLYYLMDSNPELRKSLFKKALIKNRLFTEYTSLIANQYIRYFAKDATQYYAAKLSLQLIPVPVLPPYSFFKEELLGATTDENRAVIEWAFQVNHESNNIVLVKLSELIIKRLSPANPYDLRRASVLVDPTPSESPSAVIKETCPRAEIEADRKYFLKDNFPLF